MQAPVILYDNVLDRCSTYSASTLSSQVPNLKDWRTHTYLTATSTGAQQVDITMASTAYPIGAIGIASHNLPVGSTVRVFGSSDGANWTTYATIVTQTTGAIFSTFTQVGRTYYRVTVESTVAEQIGILCLGVPMQMPKAPVYGYSPFNHQTQMASNRSNAGVMLGSNVKYYSYSIDARFTNIPTSFFWNSTGGDSTFMAFWNNHARDGKPFFYAFSPDTYPAMNALVRLQDKYTLTTPMYSTSHISELALSMEGVNNP